MRNIVVAKMKKNKTEYYRGKFNDPSLSPKETWKNAYQLLGTSKSGFPNQILINNNLVCKPIEMASGMNTFFLDKIAKLKRKNVRETNFKQATEEMKQLLKSITGKKSLGLDWICSYSLKIVADELLPELKHIINLSIRSVNFGASWKVP